MAGSDGPFSMARDGIRVAVRLTPKSSRTAVDGVATDAAGAAYLKVRVNAPPEGGKANAALIKLLARQWRLPARALSVARGAGNRRKLIAVAGDGPALMAQVEGWRARMERNDG